MPSRDRGKGAKRLHAPCGRNNNDWPETTVFIKRYSNILWKKEHYQTLPPSTRKIEQTLADKVERRLNELTTNVCVAAQVMTARKMALNGDILFAASRQYRRYHFVKAEGFRKDQCGSDPEAKQFAAPMTCEHTTRPTHSSAEPVAGVTLPLEANKKEQ